MSYETDQACCRPRAARRLLMLTSALAAACTLVGGTAWAQAGGGVNDPSTAANAPPGVTDAGVDDVSGIADITVTARRKAESLQNVPLAITALTSDTLKAASATDLQDITFLTPGLTYNSNGQENDASPVIRGLSDTSGGEATSQNVSVFLDGIYVANPSAIDLSLGGLDRVEVVKGPVSGLYGRNAFTGAINYVTAKPTDDFHTDDAVTLGDYGREIVELGVSGPIVKGLLDGRVAYTFDNLDGTFTDPVSHQTGNGHQKNDFLASLTFTPDEHIIVTPLVYYGYDTFNSPVTVSYKQNCAFGTANSYCGNLSDNQLGPFIPASGSNGATGLERRVEHAHVDARAEYDFGTFDALVGFNKISTNTFNEFTGTEFGLPYDIYAPGKNNSFAGNPALPGSPVLANSYFGDQATEDDSSVELRYDTPASNPLRLGLGGFYYYRVATNNNTFGINGANIPPGDEINSISEQYVTTNGSSAKPLNYAKTGTRDYSYFVSGEWDIIPEVTLSTAIRETEEEQKEFVPGSQFALPEKLSADFHSLTSNEALTWRPYSDMTFYVSAANGEKSGGFNGAALSPADVTFDPETDWDYEAGAKVRLLDGHLLLDADVFHTDLNQLQVLGPPSGSGAIGLVVKNFGSVSENGGEISADYVVGNGLKFFAGLEYGQPRFNGGSNDFNDAASCALIPSCASSRLIKVNGLPAVNLKGLRPPFSSDGTFNLAVEYKHALEFIENVDWFARFDYRFESEQYSTVTNFAKLGPRNIINLHAGLTSGPWTLTGYVLNLSNDLTPVTSQFNGSLNGFDAPPNGNFGVTWVPVSVLPEGRTFAFRLAYHF